MVNVTAPSSYLCMQYKICEQFFSLKKRKETETKIMFYIGIRQSRIIIRAYLVRTVLAFCSASAAHFSWTKLLLNFLLCFAFQFWIAYLFDYCGINRTRPFWLCWAIQVSSFPFIVCKMLRSSCIHYAGVYITFFFYLSGIIRRFYYFVSFIYEGFLQKKKKTLMQFRTCYLIIIQMSLMG